MIILWTYLSHKNLISINGGYLRCFDIHVQLLYDVSYYTCGNTLLSSGNANPFPILDAYIV